MKICRNCGIEKDLSEFRTNGTKANGELKYKADCKECMRVTSGIPKQTPVKPSKAPIKKEIPIVAPTNNKCECCFSLDQVAALKKMIDNDDKKVNNSMSQWKDTKKIVQSINLYEGLFMELQKAAVEKNYNSTSELINEILNSYFN